MSVRLAKSAEIVIVEKSESQLRREFGLACYSAFIQLAKAFYRYFVGCEPPK